MGWQALLFDNDGTNCILTNSIAMAAITDKEEAHGGFFLLVTVLGLLGLH